MLVVLNVGFERFNSANELCNYSGLTPMIRQSGTSGMVDQESVKLVIKNLEIYFLCAVLMLANSIKYVEKLYE